MAKFLMFGVNCAGLKLRLRILIELKDCDAFGMDGFENGVNGGLGLFIEDREINFDP